MIRIPICCGDWGQILVQGHLNGREVLLLFDSGAPDTLYIETTTGTALGLPVIEMTSLHVAHRDLQASVPRYGPVLLQVGDLVFQGLYPLGVASGRSDGLLGMGALRGQSFCVDVQAREIRIGP